MLGPVLLSCLALYCEHAGPCTVVMPGSTVNILGPVLLSCLALYCEHVGPCTVVMPGPVL